jgi:uncharacterized NAD-dependent epimerase/dehydratase family protein
VSRIVILAEDSMRPQEPKTAIGLLRYRTDDIVAVVDSRTAGQDAGTLLELDLKRRVPVVAAPADALRWNPDTAAIGVAPAGPVLPPVWRECVHQAIDAGLDIVSGLHHLLADDPDISAHARARGVALCDVRRPAQPGRIARYEPHRPGSRVVLTVGTDGFSGKMTTSLELHAAFRRRGLDSSFLATGQTGIMIAGGGLPADHAISDFLPGLVEEHVLDHAARHDWVFVEGQGALNHPAYSAVTLGLVHGSLPDAMILCHQTGTTAVNGLPHCPLPSLTEAVRINETAVSWLRPRRTGRVAGIALATWRLPEDEARRAVEEARRETGLPVTDPLRFGVEPLVAALLEVPAAG